MKKKGSSLNIPTRKTYRLKDYDYSTAGAYFITICSKERQCCFSDIIPFDGDLPPQVVLSALGLIVEQAIMSIPQHYQNVSVDNYVIMPNHLHLLISLNEKNTQTISRMIQQMKGFISKQYGTPVFQNKFYDHIIRDAEDYKSRYEYIDDNPRRWSEDDYFMP
ncbi:MAG: transposase [Clostridia bacterium]|nr:transposase [Clostridia bacterium]